jgi:hypothetical protein
MKKLPVPFPSNYRQLVTRKPRDGEKTDFEVRFSIEKQRHSRSQESRRLRGLGRKKQLVWVVVGHGMIQKTGQARYQIRGIIHSQPRGKRMFEYTVSEKELRPLLGFDGMYQAEVRGLFTRIRKGIVIHGIGFYFQARKFLTDEVKKLMESGRVSRPKKWHE